MVTRPRPAKAATRRTAAPANAKAPRARSAAPSDAAKEDGRRLRAARNHEAVVTAVLGIIKSQGPGGGPLPGAAEVAKRAGVSERTVFRHFADLDALFLAAAARQRPLYITFVTPRPDSPDVAERIAQLVKLRSKLFEEIAPIRRAAIRLAVQQPVLAEQLAQAYAAAREQVADVFAPELARVDARRRAILIDALDVAAGWTTWDRLRGLQRRSVERSKQVITEMLAAQLLPLAKPKRR